MSFDMSQFYSVFFAEAGEHLDSMETILLDLDLANPDTEQLNAIFRAAHSIKGSAATFGFHDMADLTHVLENLLDRIRKGEMRLRTEIVDTILDARDVLTGQLAGHRDAAPVNVAAAQLITQRLEQWIAAGNAPSVPAMDAVGLSVSFILDGLESSWTKVIEAVCTELASLGTVSIAAAPVLPDQPWVLHLQGAPDEAAVRDVLEFVARDGTVEIAAQSALTLSPSANDDAYGLFEPLDVLADDDAYGFFAPLPEPPLSDETYGFFEPLPVSADVPPDNRPAVRQTNTVAHAEDTIRVGVGKVDTMINQVGELIITQAMLIEAARDLDPVAYERLHTGLQQLERNSRALQESVLSVRMLPIANVFNRFPRVVRDLAAKLGKQVALRISGEATELDRGLIERIVDPLTHLIRNSIDHGIEMPLARAAAGKPAEGTITLKALQQGGTIVIIVGDDGAGLDRARIVAKASERGMAVTESMTDAEVWNLIFEPGFSTADAVTDVSGRGVGMDVVKRNITAMGGRVDIESLAGVGTRMTVRLPLTLAILDGMSVGVGSHTYILPLAYITESLQPATHMVKQMGGVASLLQVRDSYVPIVMLHALFGIDAAVTVPEQGIMVLIEADGQQAALFVDALVGQQQVVIKSIEAHYRRVPGIAGATIMGDGQVAFILDAVALVQRAHAGLPAAA